jgi:acyl-CoA reductase-like NAD-dependent aldehyde dehydrogenase
LRHFLQLLIWQKVRFGGKRVEHALGGFFVQPALVEMPSHAPVMHEELFVPILYAVKYRTLEEAIAMNNAVPQGLSSSLFTRDQKNVFEWTSAQGSDCGLGELFFVRSFACSFSSQ